MQITEGAFSVSDIELGERAGRDLGDLHKLAADISHRGLRHRVTLSPELQLITGTRRLAAHQLLGWNRIDGKIIRMVPEALEAIVLEERHGAYAKPRSIAETMALDRVIRRHLKWWEPQLPGRGRKAPGSGGYNAVIARVYGLNTGQYARAREICEAANGFRSFNGVRTLVADDVRERAVAAEALLDDKSQILAVYRWFKEDLPEEDYAPNTRHVRSGVRAENVSSALATLAGITYALQQLDLSMLAFDAEQAADWDAEAAASMAVLRDFRRQLKEGP